MRLGKVKVNTLPVRVLVELGAVADERYWSGKRGICQIQQLGSIESLENYKGHRSTLTKEIRRAKRGHEASLADKVKENPKRFYKYIQSKRVTRERTVPIKNQTGLRCVMWSCQFLYEHFSSVFMYRRSQKQRNLKRTVRSRNI